MFTDSTNFDSKQPISIGSIEQKVSTDRRIGYRQQIMVGSQKMAVSVYYQEGSHLTDEKVQNDMTVAIQKMVSLAEALEMGKQGLFKVQATPAQVIGHWHGPNRAITRNVREKLIEDLNHAQASKKESIQRKIQLVDEITHIFTTRFPKTAPIESQKPSSELKPIEQKAMVSNLFEFNQISHRAESTLNRIAQLEKNRLQQILQKNTEVYNSLDKRLSVEELAKLRESLSDFSLAVKNDYDQNHSKQFNQLENQLVEMTCCFNSSLNKRMKLEAIGGNKEEIAQMKSDETVMRKKIQEVNSKTTLQNLTTNAYTATKANVMAFAAVVEKRLDLMESMERIIGNSSQKKSLKLINEKLQRAPSINQMHQEESKIIQDLEKPLIALVSSEEAKTLNEVPKALKWGESHLNFALTTPANWPTLHTALIKESKAGRMYVSVTRIEPLNIEKKGGVPSGLRRQSGKDKHPESERDLEKFDDRATNLMKTTTYIKTDSGKESSKQVSFRGGQFPTSEAAYEALKTIQSNLELGQRLEELHINALLTPMTLTFIKNDKSLLETHKESILKAIDRLIEEAQDKTELDSLKKLHNQMAISNFGVNEGAVGQTVVKGMTVGWYTAISGYSNEAAEKVNQALARKMALIEQDPFHPDHLDKLGALVQVGREMEAIWAKNDYEDATVGNNQFKMPALWKTFDELLNVTSYMNCMSGKDRTSKVESTAQEYLDEIAMNIEDQRLELTGHFDKISVRLNNHQTEAWEKHRTTLTAACFTTANLDTLAQLLQGENGIEYFALNVKQEVGEKIGVAKYALGLEKNGPGLLESKKEINRITGTPTNEPKLNTRQVGPHEFPPLAATSVYRQQVKTSDLLQHEVLLVDRQRQARNRRDTQLAGHLQVTQMNTSRPGFKVKGGEPLERFASGFDRDYVLLQLYKQLNNQHPKQRENLAAGIYQWTSLHELDMKTAAKFTKEIEVISEAHNTSEWKLKEWGKILEKIEKAHLEALLPKAKVKT